MGLPAAPLVGRVAELALMDEALAEVTRGRWTALDLVGEPGIGKTRLLEELAGDADRRGALVLSGSGSELERDLPFWVFVNALDDFVRALDPRLLDQLDDEVRADLAHVLPALSRRETSRADPLAHERYRTHRAVRELLGRLTATSPLVLILDDLHWADPASVELIASLLRRPPEAGVLLALALRPDPGHDRLDAELEHAHAAGTLRRIPLGALTREDADQLLGARSTVVSRPGCSRRAAAIRSTSSSSPGPHAVNRTDRGRCRRSRRTLACRWRSRPRWRRSSPYSARRRAWCCAGQPSSVTPSNQSLPPQLRA